MKKAQLIVALSLIHILELPFLQKGTVSQKHGTATRLSILREPVTTGGDTCYFLEKHTEALHIRIA